jgi:uncharacterized protein
MINRILLTLTALALTALASCAPQIPTPAPTSHAPTAPIFATSFICQDGNLPVQNAICGNQNLAALDTQLATIIRQHLASDNIVSRDEIMATQRAWLLNLPGSCHITAAASPDAIACLTTAYQTQLATLTNWPSADNADSAATIAHYSQYQPLDAKQPSLCSAIITGAATAFVNDGSIDPSRLTGAREIAGSHGAATGTLPDGTSVTIDLYRSGLYGGYQTRARALTLGGQSIINPSSVGAYIQTLPNNGGRFGSFASQTGDYGSIDVFTLNGIPVALVSEVIGYNSPAPPGETADAALFTLSPTTASPGCLFRTYTMPPPLTQGVFSEQPSLTPFLSLIDSIQGTPPQNLAQSDLQEIVYFNAATRWMLFNMPLVVVAQNRAANATGFLRHRHDQVLDALSAWGNQNPANQAQLSHLLNLLRPAAIDLDSIYVQQQGLSASDAEQATSLAMLELLWQATNYMSPAIGAGPVDPLTYQHYQPRYPILGSPPY